MNVLFLNFQQPKVAPGSRHASSKIVTWRTAPKKARSDIPQTQAKKQSTVLNKGMGEPKTKVNHSDFK